MIDANNLTNATAVLITRCPQSYVPEAVIVGLLFIVGCPLNIFMCKLLHSKHYNTYRLPHSFKLLQRQLNISDLLILCVWAPIKLILHILRYQWPMGTAMCILMRFSMGITHQLSASIICAIAIDRLIAPYKRNSVRRSYVMIACVWLSAIALNLYHLASWTERVFARNETDDLVMCFTREEIKWQMPNGNHSLHKTYWTFQWLHMTFTFWIPTLILIVCYSLLVFRLFRVSKECSPKKHSMNDRQNDHEMLDPIRSESVPNHDQTDSTSVEDCDSILMVPSVYSGYAFGFGPETEFEHTSTGDVTVSSQIRERKQRQHQSKIQQFLLKSKRNSALKITLSLSMAHILCWIPYNIMAFINNPGAACYKSYIEDLVVLNTIFNPFLYGIDVIGFSVGSPTMTPLSRSL